MQVVGNISIVVFGPWPGPGFEPTLLLFKNNTPIVSACLSSCSMPHTT